MIFKKKQELRLLMKQATARLTRKEMTEQAEEVFGSIERTEEFRKARTVALFWSVSDEIPTHDFIKKWTEEGRRVVLPVIEGDNMSFAAFTADGELEPGLMRIMQPNGEQEVSPDEIDLIIVPGSAFDRKGFRLGRGKGYYDRYLANLMSTKVGVCLDHQLVDEVPVHEHDIRVDRVVTRGETVECKGGQGGTGSHKTHEPRAPHISVGFGLLI